MILAVDSHYLPEFISQMHCQGRGPGAQATGWFVSTKFFFHHPHISKFGRTRCFGGKSFVGIGQPSTINLSLLANWIALQLLLNDAENVYSSSTF